MVTDFSSFQRLPVRRLSPYLEFARVLMLSLSQGFSPLYGKLSDIIGRKPILFFSIVIFLLGSALCGAAKSFIWLALCKYSRICYFQMAILISNLFRPRSSRYWWWWYNANDYDYYIRYQYVIRPPLYLSMY